jgi:haloacetate dehalogenase
LAERNTVVVPDLPGYGRSRLTDDGSWAKRDVARELVEMMTRLGHDQFAVIGHDRGARVGYRLALDHPDRVSAFGSLAVVPTLDVWPAITREFAKSAFQWFLFLQPDNLPEKLLAADPDSVLDVTLTGMAGSLDRLHPDALADYRSAFRTPSVRAAMIEDYQTAYGIDVDHESADRISGRRITCPVLVIWPDEPVVAEGTVGTGADAVDVWRRWADDVSGIHVDCGHLIPEHAANEVIAATAALLRRADQSTALPSSPAR